MLSAMRALHGCRSDTGHAKHPEEQHQKTSDLAHSWS